MTAEAKQARTAALIQLANDCTETFDREDARHLLKDALKQPPKGKQPNKEENRGLLELLDLESAKTPDRVKEVPRRIGKQLHPLDPLRAEAVEKRVRRLGKKRARQRAAWEEYLRLCGPTLLE